MPRNLEYLGLEIYSASLLEIQNLISSKHKETMVRYLDCTLVDKDILQMSDGLLARLHCFQHLESLALSFYDLEDCAVQETVDMICYPQLQSFAVSNIGDRWRLLLGQNLPNLREYQVDNLNRPSYLDEYVLNSDSESISEISSSENILRKKVIRFCSFFKLHYYSMDITFGSPLTLQKIQHLLELGFLYSIHI
jgi:hypothetical protein